MSLKEPAVSKSYSSYRRILGVSVVAAYTLQCILYLFTWMTGFLPSWVMGWIRWCPTSSQELEDAEEKILSYVKKPYNSQFINIGKGHSWTKDNLIRTVSFHAKENNTPMVLIHGFASGVGLWILNLDSFSSKRTVYAFDTLGFGRSSRPNFSTCAMEAEYQLIQSIEEWREQMKIDRFILCGHSMGGFLASSYALQYPDRVAHLILADPWGFPEWLPSTSNNQYQLPVWVKAISAVLQPFNPLVGLRVAGPWGPQLVDRLRPDLRRKFESLVEDTATVSNYIYHCNAQTPSGESAFKAMTAHFSWSKHPMITRIGELREDIPITFVYGSRSWVDRQPGIQIKCSRTNSYVDVQVIQGAGHHVYADRPDQFNSIIQSVCDKTDLMEAQKQDKLIKFSDKILENREVEIPGQISDSDLTDEMPAKTLL